MIEKNLDSFRPENNVSQNNQLHSNCIQQFNELKKQNDILKAENASLNEKVDRRNVEVNQLARNGQEGSVQPKRSESLYFN